MFDLWKKTPERDSVTIKQYRLLYLENGLKICLYCNQSVDKDLQLDHLFPWSRFPVNSFWNLYPVCSSCNSTKSDKIPIINKELKKRIEKHLKYYLDIQSKDNNLITSDIIKLYQTKFKSSPNSTPRERQREEILEYIRNLSSNLLETVPGYEF